MKKHWQYVSLAALAVAALCLVFDLYISDRCHLDLTINLFGLDFGIARFSTDSDFYWFGARHLIPLDAILYAIAFIAVCFALVYSVKNVRNLKRFVGLVLASLLVGIITIHVCFHYCLAGVYDDLQMACDCQWVFKDGQIYMATERGREHVGTYTRSGGRWICRPLKGLGEEFYMESSLLGIWWPDPQFQGGGRFLPRRCFSPFGATLYDWHIRI